MTNDDELLKRLESTGGDKGFPWTTMTQAAARIRELKAELQAKADALAVLDVKGVLNGTHVIVPVEPTEAMVFAGEFERGQDDSETSDIYRAMIRAAQGVTGGVSSTPEQEGSP